MSIFGKMDTEKISDNPWEVKDNVYWSIITKAYVSNKDDQDWVNFTFSINEPDNDFHGQPLRLRFKIFPDVDDINDLEDPEDKKEQKKLMRFLTRGLGLSREQAKTVELSELIGEGSYLKVVNNKGTGAHEGKIFTNITDQICEELYKQEDNAVSRSVGL